MVVQLSNHVPNRCTEPVVKLHLSEPKL
ncbi:protein of unknown function [Streptomyces sp. KY70]|nr:protein of unknown function [Streptomyces sp. KY70]